MHKPDLFVLNSFSVLHDADDDSVENSDQSVEQGVEETSSNDLSEQDEDEDEGEDNQDGEKTSEQEVVEETKDIKSQKNKNYDSIQNNSASSRLNEKKQQSLTSGKYVYTIKELMSLSGTYPLLDGIKGREFVFPDYNNASNIPKDDKPKLGGFKGDQRAQMKSVSKGRAPFDSHPMKGADKNSRYQTHGNSKNLDNKNTGKSFISAAKHDQSNRHNAQHGYSHSHSNSTRGTFEQHHDREYRKADSAIDKHQKSHQIVQSTTTHGHSNESAHRSDTENSTSKQTLDQLNPQAVNSSPSTSAQQVSNTEFLGLIGKDIVDEIDQKQDKPQHSVPNLDQVPLAVNQSDIHQSNNAPTNYNSSVLVSDQQFDSSLNQNFDSTPSGNFVVEQSPQLQQLPYNQFMLGNSLPYNSVPPQYPWGMPFTHQHQHPAPNCQPFMPNIEIWFYIDLHGSIQGAFSSTKMRKWFEMGHLKFDLLLRKGENGGFFHLKDWFPQVEMAFLYFPDSLESFPPGLQDIPFFQPHIEPDYPQLQQQSQPQQQQQQQQQSHQNKNDKNSVTQTEKVIPQSTALNEPIETDLNIQIKSSTKKAITTKPLASLESAALATTTPASVPAKIGPSFADLFKSKQPDQPSQPQDEVSVPSDSNKNASHHPNHHQKQEHVQSFVSIAEKNVDTESHPSTSGTHGSKHQETIPSHHEKPVESIPEKESKQVSVKNEINPWFAPSHQQDSVPSPQIVNKPSIASYIEQEIVQLKQKEKDLPDSGQKKHQKSFDEKDNVPSSKNEKGDKIEQKAKVTKEQKKTENEGKNKKKKQEEKAVAHDVKEVTKEGSTEVKNKNKNKLKQYTEQQLPAVDIQTNQPKIQSQKKKQEEIVSVLELQQKPTIQNPWTVSDKKTKKISLHEIEQEEKKRAAIEIKHRNPANYSNAQSPSIIDDLSIAQTLFGSQQQTIPQPTKIQNVWGVNQKTQPKMSLLEIQKEEAKKAAASANVGHWAALVGANDAPSRPLSNPTKPQTIQLSWATPTKETKPQNESDLIGDELFWGSPTSIAPQPTTTKVDSPQQNKSSAKKKQKK